MAESKAYIGTKIVNAEPMTHDEFKRMQGKQYGDTPDQQGYCVTYEDGYRSWSPKETFERAYREITDSEKALVGPF